MGRTLAGVGPTRTPSAASVVRWRDAGLMTQEAEATR